MDVEVSLREMYDVVEVLQMKLEELLDVEWVYVYVDYEIMYKLEYGLKKDMQVQGGRGYVYDIILYGKVFLGGKCYVFVEVIMMKFIVVMM